MVDTENAEPFPNISPVNTRSQHVDEKQPAQDESNSPTLPSAGNRPRGSSLVQSFRASNPPLGVWQVAGEVGSKIPTLPEIRDGAFSEEGWSPEGQLERRGTDPHEIHRRTRGRRSSASMRTKPTTFTKAIATDFLPQSVTVEEGTALKEEIPLVNLSQPSTTYDTGYITKMPMMIVETPTPNMQLSSLAGPDATGTYPNGYRFPKKHSWSTAVTITLRAAWKSLITPWGFLITVYALNVVAWGAMIFFLLVEAAPKMCHPSCNDPYSARRIWIEIDSQILNALFCVPAFGLIPWRFRDFYYLLRWRYIKKDYTYHRRLAGIYRGWYRLPGSDELAEHVAPPPAYMKKDLSNNDDAVPYSFEDVAELEDNDAVPLPVTSIPDPPLTGIRSRPTWSWHLDAVIGMYLANTLLQVILAGCMWGMNRFTRPSWVTGMLISLGIITGAIPGIIVFREGKRVKQAEGIPVQEYDVLESADDYQERKTRLDKKAKGRSWFTRH